MQQATANMLADMHALPTTLMSGLVMPIQSSDTQAPTVTITSPAAVKIANGAQVVVTGTASDNGGGQVAGVEVSTDAGVTWHPATGTSSWSYTGILNGDGGSAVKVRATDDSANTSAPQVLGAIATCPCSLFGNATPPAPDAGDPTAVEVGVHFSSDEDGYVTGVRFYKATANTGTHTGSLWTAAGTLLATGTFSAETASGWQTMQFSSPVAITAGTSYVAGYWAPNGHYTATSSFFYYKPYDAAPLHAENTAPDASTVNGVYATSPGFPTSTFHAANYFVDVMFNASATVPPTVTAQTPSPGAGSVLTSVTPTATFSKAINSSSIGFTLTGPNNGTVPSTTTYNGSTKTATLTPNAALDDGTLYTATITASDTNGNSLTAPYTWNFRTAYAGQVGGSCPCTIFTDSTVPATVTQNDPSSVELGVKFTADTDGVISGVRFYKGPQNVGTHTGSLWTTDGTQLATAVFRNESSTGWQTVTFLNPVAVAAGTTYIASYHTTVGYYSATVGAYNSTGVDNFPLHVPVNGGVYSYAGGFPNSTSASDYGVDVVFTVPASVVPTVSSSDPSDGDTNIGKNSQITATLSTAILSGTTTVAVTSSGGAALSGTTAIDSSHQILTFTPAVSLASDTTYTVSVSGARSLSGTVQAAPNTWSFSTSGSTCPCTLFPSNSKPTVVDSGDTSAISLGVRVVPSVSGYITGVRFYKSAANTGAHTGALWSTSGGRLATATFTKETASGWQKASFSQPVAVDAGTAYIVSYYTPTGHYSYTGHFFDSDYVNGLLTVPGGVDGVYHYGGDAYPADTFANNNYWVDAVFSTTSTADSVPPSVVSTDPLDGATSVSTSATPSVRFSEPITASSLSVTMTTSGNSVAGTAGYDPASQTATFTPTSPLLNGLKYVLSASAADTAGNAMAAAYTWSFETAQPSPAPGVCPCSVWNDGTTPVHITDPDTRELELGVKFNADVNGQIVGVRFYKGPANTGSHIGTLWAADGTQLATGTFRGESTTGWQSLTFATPVSVTAGTTYVVSYHASNGAFSFDTGTFASSGIDNSPLHVGAHAALYIYGGRAFPTNPSDANYWVDPVFTKAIADTTAPVISNVSAAGSGSTLTVTWTTDEPSTSRVDYGTAATALSLNATSSGLTLTHSVNIVGIAPNTRYYYRVTSADASNNSTTSPAAASAPATWAPA
jgi:methionine-rich copper-binding protein CopC